MTGKILIGIGGWTYAPWRGPFYPADLTQKRELEYAADRLSSIEINGTYYGSQKPESFEKWRDETPDGFVFALKGPRFATNRRVLAEAGPSIERFFDSGVMRLGEKLGPVSYKRSDEDLFLDRELHQHLQFSDPAPSRRGPSPSTQPGRASSARFRHRAQRRGSGSR